MKNIIITGATSGIGYETAKGLLSKDNNLILTSRDIEKGEETKVKLLKEGDYEITIIHCDLSSLASIDKAIDNIRSKFNNIDILINNAGIWLKEDLKSEDKLEMTFAVNYIGPYYFTKCLLPLIYASPKDSRRIIIVGSEAHSFGTLDLNNLQTYSFRYQYGMTKLLDMIWAFQLARVNPEISINCLHPGVISTGLWRELPKFIRFFTDKILKSPKSGAETSIYLAKEPSVQSKTGKYWSNCKLKEPLRICYDEKIQDRLIGLTEDIITKCRKI